jgi:hypothetical protein
MKKTNFFKLLLVGSLALSFGGFVGCTGDLEDRVGTLEKKVGDIETFISTLQSTGYIKSATKDGNKLVVVAVKGSKEETITYEPTNIPGGSTVTGSVITKEDGFWVFDGEKTAYKVVPDGPAGINMPEVRDDKFWYFWNPDLTPTAGYEKSAYYAGAWATVDGNSTITIMALNDKGEIKSITMPTSSAAAGLTKLEILGVTTLGASYDLDALPTALEVKYNYFEKFTAGTGVTTLPDGFTWPGFAPKTVVNTLAAQGKGLLVQTNPGATLTGNFKLITPDGEDLPVGFGEPIPFTGSLTRAAAPGGIYFIPFTNTATAIVATAEASLKTNFTDKFATARGLFSFVANGVNSNYGLTATATPNSSLAPAIGGGATSAMPTNGAVAFQLLDKDGKVDVAGITGTTDAVFATAASGAEYTLSLPTAANGDACNIVDYYIEWDNSETVTGGKVEIIKPIAGTRAADLKKGLGFKVSITENVESVGPLNFKVWMLGADGKVHADVLAVTAKPANMPKASINYGSYTIEKTAATGEGAWVDANKKRLMPAINISLADMFTELANTEKNGYYAGTTTFADVWKSTNGPKTVELTSVKIGTGAPIGAWTQTATENIACAAETGFKLEGKASTDGSGDAVAANEMYKAQSLTLTIPSSYGATTQSPTFADAGKEYSFTFTFKNGAKVINTIEVKIKPVIPTATIEKPYKTSGFYWIDGVLHAYYVEPGAGVTGDAAKEYEVVVGEGGVFESIVTDVKFSIVYPEATFALDANNKPIKGTKFNLSDYIAYDEDAQVYTLFNGPTAGATPTAAEITARATANWITDGKPVTVTVADFDGQDFDGAGNATADTDYDTVQAYVTGSMTGTDQTDAQTALDAAKTTAITAREAAATTELQDENDAEAIEAGKAWTAYGNEIKMAPTAASYKYLGVYEITDAAERAKLGYSVKILSPIENGGKGRIEIKGGAIELTPRQEYKIGTDYLKGFGFHGEYPLFKDDAGKYANNFIKEVKFYAPDGCTGYTILDGGVPSASDSTADPAVPSTVIIKAGDHVVAGTTKLGVKVTDRFGKVVKNEEIVVKLIPNAR